MGSYSSPTSSNTITNNVNIMLFLLVNIIGLNIVVSGGNFSEDFDVINGSGERAKILNDGEVITLSLDKESGSGFQSKNKYIFGNFNMKIKLVPGDSTGTVTTYYLWSNGSKWDEIDFGFFGNRSGKPYMLHTNVIAHGKGNREQQFHLWFDPTAQFHTYSILWNPQRIIFYVDDAPIRVFRNLESDEGIPYPKQKPMRLFCSISSTERAVGPTCRTDWSKAPFTAAFTAFDASESCPCSSDGTASSCKSSGGNSSSAWLSDEIDLATKERVKWVQNNYMVYSYCNDMERFPNGLPPECDIDY